MRIIKRTITIKPNIATVAILYIVIKKQSQYGVIIMNTKYIVK